MKQTHVMGEETRRTAQQEKDKLREEIGDLMTKLTKVPDTQHTLPSSSKLKQFMESAAATCCDKKIAELLTVVKDGEKGASEQLTELKKVRKRLCVCVCVFVYVCMYDMYV
jgi:hypothetical protein